MAADIIAKSHYQKAGGEDRRKSAVIVSRKSCILMKKLVITLLILIKVSLIYSQNYNNQIDNYRIDVQSFLRDEKITQLAKDLYQEKVRPNDSNENLSLIDSINSTGKARGFYFIVITKTMKYADGAYSEPLGIAAKQYVEKNTVEFLSYFFENENLLTKQDLYNWASLVYAEIQIGSEGKEENAVNELKTKMIRNCKGLPSKFNKITEEFIGRMK